MGVIQKVQVEYNNPLDLYKRNKRSGQPDLSVTRWLLAAHRARIVSSFPELDIVHDRKSMNFTLENITGRSWCFKGN